VGEALNVAKKGIFCRAVDLAQKPRRLGALSVIYDEEGEKSFTPTQAMFQIVHRQDRKPLAEVTNEWYLDKLFNVSKDAWADSGLGRLEQCGRPAASAPPIEVVCSSRGSVIEKENMLFNVPVRRALYGPSPVEEKALITSKLPPSLYPPSKMLPAPTAEKQRFTNIRVPSMRRFVTDSGKLAKLDSLLFKLKEGGHRVLLYFQMTKMIDLMEEFLTYRNYKYLRLDGSTKLEDRRDTVHDFQTRPEIFIFLLSTRAGGLGINLTSADTVIFYDSDWNPTIDSQAMDRAHRLGQTKQVTVYRLITRGTIEERIRKRALQKEEVQRVVISGQAGGDRVVDFNNRSRETNRTKEMAMWLADDDQAAAIERREAEVIEEEAKSGGKKKRKAGGKKKEISMDDMYHEGEFEHVSPLPVYDAECADNVAGEGKFEDGNSNEASGAATPLSTMDGPPAKKRKGLSSKKAKTVKQRLAVIDGEVG
jgi:DNA helicase INO80